MLLFFIFPTIDDHVKKIMENNNEYFRKIGMAIISIFLNIDIHIYTNLNGISRKNEIFLQ